MPFGIFVGVNNHLQSVLFAGVLMRDGAARSFKWVFNEFLTLMGGKAPMTIFTDQCKAMDKAIRSVFPGITHLWSKWHILKDAPVQLGTLYSKNSPFRRDFDYIINEMLTKDEFERAWADLLDRYKLQEHPFMIKTYNKRKMWAKPWAKDKFCARMASTQKSESANNMLKKLVPRNSPMNRFVEQYMKLMFICDSAEHKAEHQTKQIVNRSTRIFPIERHAMSLYTKKAYELFSGEVDKAIRYKVIQGSVKNEFTVHYNAELREHWRRSVFTVKVVDAGERYICECGLYEHFGMLCCHAIKVLIDSGVSKIPMAHILKRWTREARDFAYQDISADTNDASVTDELQHNQLHVNALEVVGIAKNDKQIHGIVARHLKSAMAEIERLVDWRSNQPGYSSPTDNGSNSASDAEAVNGNSYGAAGISARMSDVEIENMGAPAVCLPQGRPI